MTLLQACGGKKEKYTFEYKLKEGDTFSQNSTIDVKATQTMMGQEIDITTTITANIAFTVTKVVEGKYEIEMKYTEMKLDLDMGVRKITFDSNTPETVATPEDMSPMFKAMTGKPVNITIDKYGNVEKVTGFEKIIADMLGSIDNDLDEETKQQLLATGKQQFSEESIKESFKTTFFYSAGKEVSVGESWNINREISTNNIKLAANTKMTLKSVEDNIATIEVSGDVGTPKEGIVQNMQGFETKITMQGTQKGNMKVDINTGLVKNTGINMILDGELEMMGMKMPQKININTSVTGN